MKSLPYRGSKVTLWWPVARTSLLLAFVGTVTHADETDPPT
jgi:hypothetical protein